MKLKQENAVVWTLLIAPTVLGVLNFAGFFFTHYYEQGIVRRLMNVETISENTAQYLGIVGGVKGEYTLEATIISQKQQLEEKIDDTIISQKQQLKEKIDEVKDLVAPKSETGSVDIPEEALYKIGGYAFDEYSDDDLMELAGLMIPDKFLEKVKKFNGRSDSQVCLAEGQGSLYCMYLYIEVPESQWMEGNFLPRRQFYIRAMTLMKQGKDPILLPKQ